MAGTVNVAMTNLGSQAGIHMTISAMRGLNQVADRFRHFVEGLDDKILPDEMVAALKPTLDLSNIYCPVDTGELRSSGYVESRSRAGGPTAEIGYGKGGLAPYAVFVHENPRFYHEPPTQYKFLQRAMDEDTPDILGRLASGIKRRTGL